jgi:ATP-binding cassette, subfamily B, bacterial
VARDIVDRPKAKSVQPLRALWPFVKPYRGKLALALLALGVAAGASLSLPAAVGQMIDHGFSAADARLIDRYFVVLFAVAAVLAVATPLRFYFVTLLGERVMADLRDALYRHLLRLSPAFFESTRVGEVLSRLTTDTTLIQTVVGSSASVALRSIITLIGSVVLMALTAPKLAAVVLLGIPLVVLPIVIFGKRVQRLSRESQDRIADASAIAGEVLQAIRTVQSFAREPQEAARFGTAVSRSYDVAVKRTRARAWLTATVIFLVFGAIVFVLWMGAKAVLLGTMSGGDLSKFVLYAVFAAGSTGALTEVWGDVQRAAGAMERLAELLATPSGIVERTDARSLPPPIRGAIRFNNVEFRYPSRPDVAALKDFSLAIEPGETIALVGPSGAGKSTVFSLLLRFYDWQHGAIEIDGVDIRALKLDALREAIGVVPQDPVIFGFSARENIAYARPDAAIDAIEDAAKRALAHEFIDALPERYESYLGERGVRLSGGQQQRIVIARAMLKNAPILLLDEATSALDSESEAHVQAALERLIERRTTLVIAHRLSTVLKADRIVVLDQGRIVGIGPHRELLTTSPLYARLAELQFGGGNGG